MGDKWERQKKIINGTTLSVSERSDQNEKNAKSGTCRWESGVGVFNCKHTPLP